jgi:hypothetical protein
LFGNSLALADYGSLGVLAEIDVLHTVAPCDANPFPGCGGLQHHAFANASFRDTLTIDHPTLNGTSALISFTWALSGSGSLTTVDPSGAAQAHLGVALFGMLNDVLFFHFGTGVHQNGSLAMEDVELTSVYQLITLGSPFDIEFRLDAQASLDLAPPVNVPFSVDGLLAFNNTALLTGLVVTDGLGNPLDDFLLTAESGRTYPPTLPTIEVPEPSPGLLVLAAMALVQWRGRRSVKLFS